MDSVGHKFRKGSAGQFWIRVFSAIIVKWWLLWDSGGFKQLRVSWISSSLWLSSPHSPLASATLHMASLDLLSAWWSHYSWTTYLVAESFRSKCSSEQGGLFMARIRNHTALLSPYSTEWNSHKSPSHKPFQGKGHIKEGMSEDLWTHFKLSQQIPSISCVPTMGQLLCIHRWIW